MQPFNGGRHASNSAKSGPPPEPPRRPAPPPPPRWRSWLPLIGIALSVLLLYSLNRQSQKPTETLNYSPQFLGDVNAGKVKSVSIDENGKITGTLKDGTLFASQIPTALNDSTLGPALQDKGVVITATQAGQPSLLLNLVFSIVPFALLIGLFWWMGRRASQQLAGGLGSVGRSRAKLFDAEKPTTRFADVAGYEGAKQEVSEVVDFLRHPDRYTRAGAVGPKGVLMIGPPGTGKTLMARAVAGEAGVPFLSVTGSSFVEMFVGVGAARVRDLFADARKRAPSIVFIDEVDAIGGRRGGAVVSNDERDQTLNQMLAEMDGFDPAAGVVVIAATNRPEILDPALLRPGRFDRQVTIPLPTQRERLAILKVHAHGKKFSHDADFSVIARGTPGYSGADLANLINEAAINAVRAHRDVISAADLDEARDRVLLGRRDSSNALLPDEKYSVSVHESGHALVAVLTEHGDPVAKVTILPAGQALGVTEQLPVDERRLYTEGYLKDSLAIRLGGRAAEELVLGESSTGASNDLAGATDLATRMVREFGMSEVLGPVGFSSGTPMYLGNEQVTSRPYAESTQRVIDEEVARLLREARERALELLRTHREALDRLTAVLLDRETIDGSVINEILGEPTVPVDDRQPVGAGHPAAGALPGGHAASHPAAAAASSAGHGSAGTPPGHSATSTPAGAHEAGGSAGGELG